MRGSKYWWNALSLAIATLLLFSIIMPSFAASASPAQKHKHHPLGFRVSDKNTLSRHTLTMSPLSAKALPSSENWSANMPPVGDQGEQNSCVAWSVGYAYKSYQDQMLRNWGDGTANHEFSPSYIYNQIDGGSDNGAAFSDAMTLLVNQGCDTLDDLPYNQYDCTTQPTALQKARAANFKEASWASLPMDSQLLSLKTALTQGPVVVGVNVFWSPGWSQSGDINLVDIAGLSAAGGHGICIVGYDDNHQTKDGSGALEFINSWGASWGYSGYGWMSYAYAAEEISEADTMVDSTTNLPTIAISPTTLMGITAYKSFSQVFTATGGKAPYTYTESGDLPNGLTFSGRTLKGTPTVAGKFPITITVADVDGFVYTNGYTLAVTAPTIEIGLSSIPAVVAGKLYSKVFTATGGKAPYTYTESGDLPDGLSFSGNCLSGIPTVAGSFSIAVTAADANGFTDTKTYTLVVRAK